MVVALVYGVTTTVALALFTVSVAADEFTVVLQPVNWARYLLPLCETVGLLITKDVLVAPPMGLKIVPPSVLTCH